ncbi:MAG: DHHA1 domain-containing protein [Oscillospiraceae bacterium]|nr:DHHA1 domain-containing protein [Oscillospiraceae bacterium]
MLFFGLCTDTGFFRHVDERGAETFRVAARLIQFGASPKSAYAAINGGKSLDSRILLGHILSRAECFFEGRLVLSCEDYDETNRHGQEGRDTDNLYRLLQSIEGVEAIVVIRQESPEYCTVGFRSLDRINVADIACSFGGGGHKNAAGLKIAGTINALKAQILEAFDKVFNPPEKK